jgi:hypothetical protein
VQGRGGKSRRLFARQRERGAGIKCTVMDLTWTQSGLVPGAAPVAEEGEHV